MMADHAARVYLVGAGPGHPGLLTVRAVECLGRADLVLYDNLVPRSLLDYAPAHAERMCVTELPGCRPERWPHIHRTMIEAARQGRCVVRLKGGDPFVFGRGGEEAEALAEAGIPFEVVPGITAALGAAACAGIPLTHRLHASAVALVTGHEQPGKSESGLNWPELARFPGTLVIYMGIARLSQIVQSLLDHGKRPETPAAVIERGTTGEQRTVEASLSELPVAVQRAGLKAPALIVIGAVAGLRPRLAWFEKLPLFGKHILITRPRRQSAGLARRLEELGAVAHLLPAVDIEAPADWGPVDRALSHLTDYDWLVFTSANGVQATIERLRQLGRDLRALGHLRLAVIGPSTAEALRGYHLEPDLMPPEYRSESLAAVLRQHAAGQRLLLLRADRGRETLSQELAPVASVEQVAVYRQIESVDTNSDAHKLLRDGRIDYVTLTSSNIARALLRTLDEPCRRRLQSGAMQIVSISPVTTGAIREMGFPVSAEAGKFTAEGVVQALIALAAAR